jgi:hypothetical protein
MKKLLVAAMAVLLASPAFAAVQNVKVSGDITASYLNRQNFDAGLDVLEPSMEGLSAQSVWATQTRVRIDADLTDNVSTTVRLLNETVWDGNYADGTGLESGSDIKAVDLDLAYVTLREFLYSPLTLTIGRQEIVMGNGNIIDGGPNPFTTGHFNGIADDLTTVIAVDAIKAVLDYKPLTITSFWYKNAQTLNSIQGLYNNQNGSSDVYGLDAAYQLSDPYSTLLEGYLFTRFDGKGLNQSANQDKSNSLYVPGLRVSTNPTKELNIQGEFAWQLGHNEVINGSTQESESRSATFAQLMATYTLPVLEKYKPSVTASYTYASGDKNGLENANNTNRNSNKTDSAWDPFAEGQGGGTIYSAILPLSNLNIYSVSGSFNPLQDVTAAFTWSDLYAADSYTNPVGGNVGGNPLFIYQPNQNSGTLNYFPGKKDDTGLGNEYDVNLTYNYTEDVTFGLNLGWFVFGDAFSHYSNFNPTTASQAIADINVKF